MIDPAVTVWPANTLTPSRWAAESRPFFEEPRPFLCAIAGVLLGLRRARPARRLRRVLGARRRRLPGRGLLRRGRLLGGRLLRGGLLGRRGGGRLGLDAPIEAIWIRLSSERWPRVFLKPRLGLNVKTLSFSPRRCSTTSAVTEPSSFLPSVTTSSPPVMSTAGVNDLPGSTA